MLEWKQSSYQRKHNKCPRCMTRLKEGRCPKCDWPGFKLPNNMTTEQWNFFEERVKEFRRIESIKRKAIYAVKKAIKKGELTRPKRCELCGEMKKIEAHHWSYLQIYWLDVIWLCIKCHNKQQDHSDKIMTEDKKPDIQRLRKKEEERKESDRIISISEKESIKILSNFGFKGDTDDVVTEEEFFSSPISSYLKLTKDEKKILRKWTKGDIIPSTYKFLVKMLLISRYEKTR